MRNTVGVTGGEPIAVWLQSISGGDAVNPLVAFDDIHGRKREVLLFIIIISPLQSTDGHRLLQLLNISLDLRLLASTSCQPSCANRHSTWPESVVHYVYWDAFSTPELIYPNGCRFYGWYGQPTGTLSVNYSLKNKQKGKHICSCSRTIKVLCGANSTIVLIQLWRQSTTLVIRVNHQYQFCSTLTTKRVLKLVFV
jgi:hypothetical protein